MSFASLPREIRDQIWSYLVLLPTTDHRLMLLGPKNEVRCDNAKTRLHVSYMYEADPPYRRFHFSTNIFRVNKQIYSETAPILYGRHVFEFDHDLPVVSAFLNRLRPSTRALLRTIWVQSVAVDRFGEPDGTRFWGSHSILVEKNAWEKFYQTLAFQTLLDRATCVMISFALTPEKFPSPKSLPLGLGLRQPQEITGICCIKLVEPNPTNWDLRKLLWESSHLKHWVEAVPKYKFEEGGIKVLPGPRYCIKCTDPHGPKCRNQLYDAGLH